MKMRSNAIVSKQNVTSVVSNNMFGGLVRFWKSHNLNSWVVFFALVYLVVLIKIATIKELNNNLIFASYSILVSFYILSRFILAFFYTPKPKEFEKSYGLYEPTVSFSVPSKNEGDNIYETIMRMVASEYPKEKFDIIAINDGSTDNTLEEMYRAKKDAKKMGVEVEVVDWKENKGKREGMAESVRRSTKEIIFFVDSDSFLASDALPQIVKYFSHPKIGAVAGHAYVANEDTNMLTKMQAVRYYVAFKAYKSAEALFGTVTCCSGCCSAYRRSSIMPFLESWVRQSFLGVRCTYGDDRSLTNYTIYYGYDCVFAPEVAAYTFVPDNMRQFMRQQFRWKKSWVRESLLASTFMWRKNIHFI